MVAAHLALVLSVAVVFGCAADPAEDLARIISASAEPFAVAASAGMWTLGGEEEEETGRRCADAVLATAAATEGLKSLTRQSRPCDPSATDGFPSGSTALAFCVASVVADREPDLAGPVLGWAAAVGWSRVKLRRHDTLQVVAGAALGYLLGRASISGEGVFGDMIVPDGSPNSLLASGGGRPHAAAQLPLISVKW